MKKYIFVLTISALSVISAGSANALAPCQAGGLTASAHKDYQMLYISEDFIRIDDKDLLKDLGQLQDLTCLQYLDATGHGVRGDVANLNNLANLEVLSLYDNPEVYGDICSLSNATRLRSLKFAFDTKVYGNISCLENLNLETFAMTNTKISGVLSSLSRMANLKALYLSGTGVFGDISALGRLANLEELGISDEYPGNSKITGDLASLDNLTNLRKVSLYKMGITNCEHFTKAHPGIQGGCSELRPAPKENSNTPGAQERTTPEPTTTDNPSGLGNSAGPIKGSQPVIFGVAGLITLSAIVWLLNKRKG